MSPQYMLDTNVLSSLMRDPDGEIASRIKAVGEHSICCSIVVAAELRYGAEEKQSSELTRRVDATLSAIHILPLSSPVDRIYARIRAELASIGTPIGPNDLFIAAHALAEQLTLVTANEKEFRRISALSVENWELG